MEDIAIFIQDLSKLSEEVSRKTEPLTEVEKKAVALINKIIAHLMTLEKDQKAIEKLTKDNTALSAKIVGLSTLNNHYKLQIQKLKEFIDRFLNPTYDSNGVYQPPDLTTIPGLSPEFIPIFQRLIQRIKELEEQKLKLVEIIKILKKKIPGLNINEPLADLQTKIDALGDSGEIARLTAEIERLKIVVKACEDSGKIKPYNPEEYNAYVEELLKKISDKTVADNLRIQIDFRYKFLINDTNFDRLLQTTRVGGVLKTEVETFLNIPKEWRSLHNLRYRNNNILKLLSISPTSIKLVKDFNIERLRKILVFSIFWDIQDLIKLWNTGLNDSIKLSATVKNRYSNFYRKLIYDDEYSTETDYTKSEKLKKNNDLIKGVVDFTTEDKVENSQFVLLDDLIEFFRSISNQYITDISQFEKDDAIIFGYMRNEYDNWKLLGPQYDKMKQYLEIDSVNVELNAKYLEENNEPVKTYLRVRCDTKPLYNEYFNLYVEPRSNINDLKSVFVTGPDPNANVPLHKTGAISTNNSSGFIPYTIADGKGPDKVGTIKQFTNYKYGYLYGPFTKVFSPTQTNSQISDLMVNDIKKTLESGNSIFVIGYGASGSGKTSSLIFRKWEEEGVVMEEQGIILEILKSLENVNDIKVSIHELFSKELTDKRDIKIDEIKYPDFQFKKQKVNKIDKYLLVPGQDPKNGTYKQLNKFIDQSGNVEWKEKNVEWKLENGKFTHSRLRTSPEKFDDSFTQTQNLKEINELGEFIITLVDTVRMVSPTPNNSQSSRSHVLVFISFNYGPSNAPVNIIIGDLAGVENKFMCDDAKTRKEFLKLVRPLEKLPFYTNKEYIDVENRTYCPEQKNIFDYYNYKNIESIDLGIFEEKLNLQKNKLDIFNDLYNIIKSGDFDRFSKQSIEFILNKIETLKIKLVNDIILANGGPEYLTLQNYVENMSGISKNFSIDKYIPYVPIDPKDNDTIKLSKYWSKFKVKSADDKPANLKQPSINEKKFIKQRYGDIYFYINKINDETLLELYKEIGMDKIVGSLNRFKLSTNLEKFRSDFYLPIYYSVSNTYINLLNRYNDDNNRDNEIKERKHKQFFNDEIEKMRTFIDSFPNASIKKDAQSLLEAFEDHEVIRENPIKNTIHLMIKHSLLYILEDLKVLTNVKDTLALNIQLFSQDPNIQTSINNILINYPKIYDDIKENKNLFYNKIKDRCNERMIEGMFINKSLYGMRKDLINIIKYNQRNAIFQRLPLFKSPCLKYYCDSVTNNCYYTKDFSDGQIKKIMNTISQKTSASKLSIIVFGMVNITQGVNDPPKMPYIDLTEIKKLRDLLYTKIDLDQEVGFNYDVEIKDKIVKLYRDKYQKIIETDFNESLGTSIVNNFGILYNAFITSADSLSEKGRKLVNLIDCLEEINSTSILGTIDFLHTMKNSLQTDINCNIINSTSTSTDIKEVEPYTNIISDSTLLSDINKQRAGVEMYAKLGGSKDKLIEKHKKLYKLYKSLKN